MYPKQIYDDANGSIKALHAHLRLTAPSDLEKTQALLTETIEKVSKGVSLLANFQASSPNLPGLGENIKRLVFECNQLSDLANNLYRKSLFTASPLRLPSRGKIITLDETISDADDAGYMQQWSLNGAKLEGNNPSREYLKKYNHLILSTAGLVDEPMRTSMSEPMEKLMNAPLAGERYNGVDVD